MTAVEYAEVMENPVQDAMADPIRMPITILAEYVTERTSVSIVGGFRMGERSATLARFVEETGVLVLVAMASPFPIFITIVAAYVMEITLVWTVVVLPMETRSWMSVMFAGDLERVAIK